MKTGKLRVDCGVDGNWTRLLGICRDSSGNCRRLTEVKSSLRLRIPDGYEISGFGGGGGAKSLLIVLGVTGCDAADGGGSGGVGGGGADIFLLVLTGNDAVGGSQSESD